MDQAQLLKEIRHIVKVEVEEIVDRKLEEKLDKKLAPLSRDVKKIRKDLEFAVGELDMSSNHLEKRVKRIEFHLGLSS